MRFFLVALVCLLAVAEASAQQNLIFERNWCARYADVAHSGINQPVDELGDLLKAEYQAGRPRQISWIYLDLSTEFEAGWWQLCYDLEVILRSAPTLDRADYYVDRRGVLMRSTVGREAACEAVELELAESSKVEEMRSRFQQSFGDPRFRIDDGFFTHVVHERSDGVWYCTREFWVTAGKRQ